MHIYVGNLSLQTTEDELRRMFTGFGEVLSVIIMNDEYIGSGQTRGYGYVEMRTKAAGTAAIAGLEGTMINERPVIVIEARPLSQDKPGIYRKAAGQSRSTKPRAR